MLIDSHCHIQALAAGDQDAVLERARARGVRGFLVPATRLEEADDVLDLCVRHEDVVCALGVHPHDASSWRAGDRERLAGLLREESVVAVGECGLDFHYDNSPRTTQEDVMREQWGLAIEHDLPVVVHNRDSDPTMLRILHEPSFRALKADFHSFAGGAEMARELLERGHYLGVTGMVTFKRADNIRELVEMVPEDRLLVETDTPFLAPEPYRGKQNEPAWVVEVATRAASVRNESVEALGRATTENFLRLFKKASSLRRRLESDVARDESGQIPANQG